MRKIVSTVVACAAALWGGAAEAVPYPFHAILELRATVNSVRIEGIAYNDMEEPVRSFGLEDVPMAPFSVGDQIILRWEQHSDNAQHCTATSTSLQLGGASGVPFYDWCQGQAAMRNEVIRSIGDTSITDSYESGYAYGPIIDLENGTIQHEYIPSDGVYMDDCCAYRYHLENDQIVIDGPFENPSGFPPFFQGGFDEDGGSLTMHFDFRTFSGEEYRYRTEGFIFVGFDVEWYSEFRRLDRVPEPGTLALAGLGLMGAGAMARRRRR